MPPTGRRGGIRDPGADPGATRFVGEATFSALASERAHTSLFNDHDPIPHIRLGQPADAVVVAPATARVIGSYAAGISSDLLTATLLAVPQGSPVVVAPAMHTEMWEHPAVQDNLATLRRRGVHVVAPEDGPPGGRRHRHGPAGRARRSSWRRRGGARHRAEDLAGLHVLVTAGGTREPIDPVRFIGNRSSGKQGHALAAEAAARGAKVTLVTTVDLPAPPRRDVVRVETAAEMEDAVLAAAAAADVVVMAAAVADFRPRGAPSGKIKKDDGVPEIVLEPTPDILAGLGARKRPGPDPRRLRCRDRRRAQPMPPPSSPRKGVDLIVANDVTAPGRWVRARHQPGRDHRCRRHRARGALGRQAGDRPCRVRRRPRQRRTKP